MNAEQTRTKAEMRVTRDPQLSPFRDLLLEYEWDNMDEHLEWVATASTEELLGWCIHVRMGEQ